MSRIRKGDKVIVIAGKDKGKTGAVLSVVKDEDKVFVENVNMIKKHTKGNPQMGQPGGIIEKEAGIHVSNVAILNPVTNKADRIGYRELKDGQKVRFFKSNNEVVDV
ncbi:MAG: 50S ribosomal protein L24 [Gammaproteobacteria bacterium]|jgi:large subunit ribosomal protein L24